MYTPTYSRRWKLPALLPLLGSLAFLTTPSAQAETAQPKKATARLNRLVELMEAKQPAFGIFSQNISPRSGASLAGSKLDFVIIDLEHSPYDVSRLETYLLGMTDKRQILEKGNLQPNVVPIVRVPSAGREHLLFVIKQVLDLGPMGVLVPHIDTAADALAVVKACRFPQLKGSPYYEPQGLRGIGYGWPARQWGLSGGEYAQRADVWPLNPKGELICWLMIETQSAVDHIKEIARVPGISGLFIGPSDLAFSMGVPLGDPAVETAMEKVLAACKEAGVACGTLDGNVKKRMEQGFQFLAVGGDGGVSGGVTEALRVGGTYRRK
ncbi:MAG: 2-dehydro-3-deoxyglucarate aldolase [Verrucomicrobiota bacterium]|jgi:4-hydroxy-2-oxoheptanedioate aldolase